MDTAYLDVIALVERLHRQFLEGQDKALHVFQTLVEQQNRLLQVDGSAAVPGHVLPSPLPQSSLVRLRDRV